MTRARIALLALLTGVFLVFIGSLLPIPTWLSHILFNTQGNFYLLSIQNIIWWLFFIALGELYYRYQHVVSYNSALRQHYLPDDPQGMLTKKDMPALYRKVRSVRGKLPEIIRNLSLRFQAGNSVEQTHEMLNSQLERWQSHRVIDYNMIRYLSWLIPILGFIGTAFNISHTLNVASSHSNLMKILIDNLTVTFHTALLALIMSALLVFLTHIIQGREKKAIRQSGQYCLDNFITRLYILD